MPKKTQKQAINDIINYSMVYLLAIQGIIHPKITAYTSKITDYTVTRTLHNMAINHSSRNLKVIEVK